MMKTSLRFFAFFSVCRSEMKAQGLQDSVAVVQGSKFGRTITPNR